MSEVCEQKFEIADDHGDNVATMTCGREKDHKGPHQENYQAGAHGSVIVIWEK